MRYSCGYVPLFFFFSSRRRHTRFDCDWSSDVCSSDLDDDAEPGALAQRVVFARHRRPPGYGEPPSFPPSSVSTSATSVAASNGFVTKRSAPRATACPPTSIAPALFTPDIATIFTAGHSRRSRPIVCNPPCPGMKMSTITTSAACRSYARIPASPSAACRTSWPACSRCFVRAWRSVTSSSMIRSRAMSPVRWAQAVGDSFLCQQPFGEVHTLLEFAEPALHLVERLREGRNIRLGGSPPGALVGASDQPSHHDLRACDHADDERGADGPARNDPHGSPPCATAARRRGAGRNRTDE